LILIVDGYNLIKQVFNKIKGKLESQRNQLIKELGYYRNKKKNSIKEILLVFDGGFSSKADRQVHNGVVVIFSGNKYSADDWIIKFTKKHSREEMLLVSKDRKLISACKLYGADSIDVYDFYDIVQNNLLEDIEKEFKIGEELQVLKLENQDFFDEQLQGFDPKRSQALDILMSQVDISNIDKQLESEILEKKEKMSKADKKIYKKIKKL
jgi:predicted RNA-binding protein with PIN domain